MATMERMVDRGENAVLAGSDGWTRPGDRDEMGTALGDALVNMRHWADAHGVDFMVEMGHAMDLHYAAEARHEHDQAGPCRFQRVADDGTIGPICGLPIGHDGDHA